MSHIVRSEFSYPVCCRYEYGNLPCAHSRVITAVTAFEMLELRSSALGKFVQQKGFGRVDRDLLENTPWITDRAVIFQLPVIY